MWAASMPAGPPPTADANVSSPPGPAAPATLAFLRSAYPQLAAQLAWLVRTQAGPRPNTFRWRGARLGGDHQIWHHFASGLDDFPRGLEATDDDENADLLAWLAMASGVLGDVAALLGLADDAARLDEQAAVWARGLDEHWDDGAGAFCERGVIGYEAVAPIGDGEDSGVGGVSEDGDDSGGNVPARHPPRTRSKLTGAVLSHAR